MRQVGWLEVIRQKTRVNQGIYRILYTKALPISLLLNTTVHQNTLLSAACRSLPWVGYQIGAFLSHHAHQCQISTRKQAKIQRPPVLDWHCFSASCAKCSTVLLSFWLATGVTSYLLGLLYGAKQTAPKNDLSSIIHSGSCSRSFRARFCTKLPWYLSELSRITKPTKNENIHQNRKLNFREVWH